MDVRSQAQHLDASERVTMPTTDRRALRFAEAVEEDFGFLAAHGFKRVQSEPTFVRFESKRVYVNVYHGRKSFEMGLEIGPLAGRLEERPYSTSEIIRLIEPGNADIYRDFATRNADGVQEGVRRLATLFFRHVEEGVLDDAGLFDRLAKQRETWNQEFSREVNLGKARRELEGAWHAQDYAKVVELLEPFRADLTQSELKKLEYAKNELS